MPPGTSEGRYRIPRPSHRRELNFLLEPKSYIYVYFYGLDPPRHPAGETKNLTQPGGQVQT